MLRMMKISTSEVKVFPMTIMKIAMQRPMKVTAFVSP